MNRFKYIIGAVVIASAFGYLVWTSFKASFQFALTPSEFLTRQAELGGSAVKIGGAVAMGSISVNGQDNYFKVTDQNGGTISVHYRGITPNTFREGAQVVASGRFDSEADILNATELITKCASKYEEKR